MRVKVCGLRRHDDVQLALDLGATHLGFVLAPDSPRAVTVEQAAALIAAVPECVPAFLVFREVADDVALAAAAKCRTRHVQLHGSDGRQRSRLESAGLFVSRAVDAACVDDFASLSARADAPLVLDNGRGGTGRRFDWSKLAPRAPRNAFIAGGLHVANVRELLPFEPWGVDVSSGVERVPGVKAPERLRAFFEAVAAREVVVP